MSNVVSYWQTRNPGLRSKDGKYALILGSTKSDRDLSSSELAALRSHSRQVDVTVGGSAAIGNDILKQVGKSLRSAEVISVPIILALLVFAFGSVVAALLPLAIGVIAILGTFAELFVLGSVTNVAIYAINLTTALGLALVPGVNHELVEPHAGQDRSRALTVRHEHGLAQEARLAERGTEPGQRILERGHVVDRTVRRRRAGGQADEEQVASQHVVDQLADRPLSTRRGVAELVRPHGRHRGARTAAARWNRAIGSSDIAPHCDGWVRARSSASSTGPVRTDTITGSPVGARQRTLA